MYEEPNEPMPALGSDTSASDSSSCDEDEDIPIYLLAGIRVSGFKSIPVSKKILRREKNRERMRKKRDDLKYKAQERDQKRDKRQNPDYTERKRDQMREKRTDPIFSERELKQKREQWREKAKDPKFREHNRQRLQEIRKNPEYVENERRQMAIKRECQHFRNEEQLKKRKMYNDNPYPEKKRNRTANRKKDHRKR